MKPKILFFGCNHSQIPYMQNLKKGYYIVATDINNDAPGHFRGLIL